MNGDVTINDFFSRLNNVGAISQEDYEKLSLVLGAVQAFDRSTYQCIYVIDYFKKQFMYVSDNIVNLCGVKAEKIKDMGYRFYIDYVPKDDLKRLVEINNQGFKLFNTLPVLERIDYSIVYNFHIIKDRQRRLVNHKLTPLILTKDGRIWLAICTISLASGIEPGNAIMKKSGSNTYYQYSFSKHQWEKFNEIQLTENEKEVLALTAQGYTAEKIAKYKCKAVDTIKNYKRSAFEKMKVNKISEAITYAQNHNLI